METTGTSRRRGLALAGVAVAPLFLIAEATTAWADPGNGYGPPGTPPGCTKHGQTAPPCGKGGAENGPGLNQGNNGPHSHNYSPNQPVSANMPAGACKPGSAVQFALVPIPSNGQPIQLPSTTADNSGAFNDSGNLPSAAGVVYVLFAACTAGDGSPAIYTTTVIVPAPTNPHSQGSAAAHTATAGGSGSSGGNGSATGTGNATGSSASGSGPAWTPPASWNEAPVQRAAIVSAVNQDATAYQASFFQPTAAHHTATTGSSGNAARDGLLAGVVVLAGASLATLRLRRRSATN